MEVIVLDVGKADAIIIKTENHAVLIDAGEESHGDYIVSYITERGITSIDYFIITHFHKDHVGGAGTVINNIPVKNLIVPNYGKESRHYDRFAEAANGTGLEMLVLTEELRFALDNAEFVVYPAREGYHFYAADPNGDDDDDDDGDDGDDDEEDNIPKENNFSIAVTIKHGANDFLFTGDAKSRRLRELLMTEGIADTDFDFLKVPHHGNHAKRSAEFIDAIRPKYAAITDSTERPADGRVVSFLKEAGAEVFFTKDGSVYCVSDGEGLIIYQKGDIK
jgi:beta-lactamase superfamily II metal-dependent hydrolase